MSKKNPAKERAREKRKKQARLRAAEHQKKQLRQEAAGWAFLNGEASAQAIALFLNGSTRAPAPTEELKHLVEQLGEVRGPINDLVASINDATQMGLRFAHPVPSHLHLLSDDSEGLCLVPHSIIEEFDSVEGISYRPIDRAFADDPHLLVGAWLVGLVSPNTPDTCFALCGNREGARACFVITGEEEWSPIYDLKSLTKILQATVDFLKWNDHPETLMARAADLISARGEPASEMDREEAIDLLRDAQGNWASEVVSLARLRTEDVRVRDEELDLITDEQDGLQSELVKAEKALRRAADEKRVLEQRLARAEARALLQSDAPQPSRTSPARDVCEAPVVPLATRLRSIF
ncbi:hypothetical protein [Variovorax sp. JS1663]|uniref:hypothetical protein n=1 Tax=Variovorax sp. JS1663 TaxID=1851577 RepID=UPI000B3428AC|nr:hypothetical protein [Variovorax sp. JS1663]OUM00107.1 hypothetical protein A8M77_23280 [Variovorax sp. JS1663]